MFVKHRSINNTLATNIICCLRFLLWDWIWGPMQARLPGPCQSKPSQVKSIQFNPKQVRLHYPSGVPVHHSTEAGNQTILSPGFTKCVLVIADYYSIYTYAWSQNSSSLVENYSVHLADPPLLLEAKSFVISWGCFDSYALLPSHPCLRPFTVCTVCRAQMPLHEPSPPDPGLSFDSQHQCGTGMVNGKSAAAASSKRPLALTDRRLLSQSNNVKL